MRFKDIAKLPSKVSRPVQFTVLPGNILLLQLLPDMEKFDGRVEVLGMPRAGFGLKDAPQAWSVALTRVLTEYELQPCKTN